MSQPFPYPPTSANVFLGTVQASPKPPTSTVGGFKVERLADSFPRPEQRLMVLFAPYTGLRAGEIGGLKIKYLNLSNVSCPSPWPKPSPT